MFQVDESAETELRFRALVYVAESREISSRRRLPSSMPTGTARRRAGQLCIALATCLALPVQGFVRAPLSGRIHGVHRQAMSKNIFCMTANPMEPRKDLAQGLDEIRNRIFSAAMPTSSSMALEAAGMEQESPCTGISFEGSTTKCANTHDPDVFVCSQDLRTRRSNTIGGGYFPWRPSPTRKPSCTKSLRMVCLLQPPL